MIRNSQLLKNSIQSLNTVRVFGQQSLLRSFGTSINDVMDLGKTYNPGKYWVSQAGIPIVDGKVHVDASIKDSILTQINKKVAVVAFNRPYCLNAFDLNMSKELLKKMMDYESDPRLNSVVQIGVGNRSFSSGGDMKMIYKLLKEEKGKNKVLEFFSNEYILDNQIATSDIPVVSILNGITMGGGAGLSLHNNYAIATPQTTFSVPEVRLGYFPDSGVSHLLAKLPRGVGFYLGLTGESLVGEQLVQAGVCQYMIDTKDIKMLVDRLSVLDTRRPDGVQHILNSVCHKVTEPTTSFAELLENINVIFGPCCQVTDSVENLLDRLQKMNNDWSKRIYKRITTSSPLSIKVTWKSIRDSLYKSLSDVLINDYRLTTRFLDEQYTKNFVEGIHILCSDEDPNCCQFIAKNKSPQFEPKQLNQVKDSLVQSFFTPLAAQQELVLPSKQNFSNCPELRGNYTRHSRKGPLRTNENSYDLVDLLLRDDNMYKRETFTHPVSGETFTTPMSWEDEQARNYRRYELEKELKRDIQRDSKVNVELSEEDKKLSDIQVDF